MKSAFPPSPIPWKGGDGFLRLRPLKLVDLPPPWGGPAEEV